MHAQDFARGELRSRALIAYGTALVVALVWALVFPGWLGLRDMLVLDHPALSVGSFGLGPVPARNAPQDGVLALVGQVLPASWVVRALLLAAAGSCAVASASFGTGFLQKAAAMTVGVYNPFVVERLLQGQWSLALAAWLLPVIAALAPRPRAQWFALWLASLTPTGLVLGLLTALWTTRARARTLAVGLACALPWLLPSLHTPPEAVGTAAFVARAEAGVGTVGSLLGLGGIWNAEAVPSSRESGFACFGVLLFALLVFHMPRRLGALAAAGLAACLLLTFGPTSWLVGHVPGLALFRDSHKLIALMIPALVAAAGAVGQRGSWCRARAGLARAAQLSVIALALLQVPDAPAELGALRGVPASAAGSAGVGWPRQLPGHALLLDPPLVSIDGKLMLNPWTKATDTVSSGQLLVDGVATEPVNPEFERAEHAWSSGDQAALRDMGFSWVIVGGEVHEVAATSASDPSSAPAAPRSLFWAGIALSTGWLLLGAGLGYLVRARPARGGSAPPNS